MDGGVLALDRAHDRRATANAPAVPGEVGDSAEGRGSRGAGGRERVEAPRAQAGNEGRAGRGDGDGEGGGHGRCGRDDRMRVPEAEKSVFVRDSITTHREIQIINHVLRCIIISTGKLPYWKGTKLVVHKKGIKRPGGV